MGGGYAKCLSTKAGSRQTDNFIYGVIQVGNLVDDSNINFKNPQRGRCFQPKEFRLAYTLKVGIL